MNLRTSADTSDPAARLAPGGARLTADSGPTSTVAPSAADADADPDTAARRAAVDQESGGSDPGLGQRFFNLRTLASFLIGFALIVVVFTRVVQVDFGAILERLTQANPLLLLLAFAAFYATFPIRALRWRTMLRSAGVAERPGDLPGIAGLAEIILLSWFANCVVPAKLGDAYRAYLLKRHGGASFSRTIGTILAERIVDVVLLFGLMVAAASLSFGRALPAEVVLLMQGGFVLVLLVVVGLVVLRNLRPLVERLLPERLHLQYHRFEQGTLHSFRRLPSLVLLSGAAWAGEVARLYLVTLALGVSGVAPSVVLFVALASALATTLPITPAGLGFAESAIVGIFLLAANAGLAPGVDEHTAVSIAILDRAISYWSLVVIGFVVYLISKRK